MQFLLGWLPACQLGCWAQKLHSHVKDGGMGLLLSRVQSACRLCRNRGCKGLWLMWTGLQCKACLFASTHTHSSGDTGSLAPQLLMQCLLMQVTLLGCASHSSLCSMETEGIFG